jgi:hypothetical protein
MTKGQASGGFYLHQSKNGKAQAAMRHEDLKSTKKYFHAHRDRMREQFNRRGRTIL